jgi:hypothetical protein
MFAHLSTVTLAMAHCRLTANLAGKPQRGALARLLCFPQRALRLEIARELEGRGLQVRRRRATRPLADRFAQYVGEPNERGCRLWQGGRNSRGPGAPAYGRFWADGQNRPASAIAWELANNRRVPDGFEVLHQCDVENCVEPSHLRVGTHRENMQDMSRKGRSASGERGGNAKLTAKQVAEIRRLLAGGESQNSVAARFGMSQSAIWAIAARRHWRAA